MINNLLYLGILLVPFLVIPGMDTRTPKDLLGLGLAISIGLATIYYGKLKPFKNRWVLVFLGYLLISTILAPDFKTYLLGFVRETKQIAILPNRDITDLWMYKAMFFIFMYTLMMICVSSIDFTKQQVKRILFFMTLAGFLTSLYIFVQVAGYDQFFSLAPESRNRDIHWLVQAHVGGFMGQATIVAPFLAMLLPLTLLIRKYTFTVIIAIALGLTMSKIAIGAGVIGLTTYFFLSRRRFYKIFGTILIVLCVGVGIFYLTQHKDKDLKEVFHAESNGRVDVWKGILEDIKTPYEGSIRAVTGFGPGSFIYSYSVRKDSRFWQAHNELLEAWYNFGLIGVGLILMAIYAMVRIIISNYNEVILGISISLLVICVCSMGTFPFQIAPTIFYSCILVGLIHNQVLGGYYDNS